MNVIEALKVEQLAGQLAEARAEIARKDAELVQSSSRAGETDGE